MEQNNRRLSLDAAAREQAGNFLGTRLRELRAGRRMSQSALAADMAARGFSWHQQTVYRIEAARQGAGFEEVLALADIFGVPLESFHHQGQAPGMSNDPEGIGNVGREDQWAS